MGTLMMERFEARQDVRGNRVGARIPVGPFPSPALVEVVAYGSAHYHGLQARAGIALRVEGGRRSVQENAIEEDDCDTGLHAAASMQFSLPAGGRSEVAARVKAFGEDAATGNRNMKVHLHVRALEAEL